MTSNTKAFALLLLIAIAGPQPVVEGFSFGTWSPRVGRRSTLAKPLLVLSMGEEPEERKPSRWERLRPQVQQRIRKAAQERAIANKQKREPSREKKRRLLQFVKQKQKEKKAAARIARPLSFDDRTPLNALIPGMELRGLVISLTSFGAYVDVGTECDGLLHVSQITHATFVEHPRQVLTPGDEIIVQVRSLNAEMKKLHLTMLPPEVVQGQQEEERHRRQRKFDDGSAAVDEQRIFLSDLQVDDELWGELRRVTDYGAYVEVGAVVDGWLHFMDHPSWERGAHPSEFMKPRDRVRVWVSDLDHERCRVKLTAQRPPHLVGPRRNLY